MMYERYHTRRIADYGGIAREVPVLAAFMLFMTLASIGLPGLNGFAGEFLLLLGMFQRAFAGGENSWSTHYRVISVLATSGVVLGAWYMLSLIRRVFFGPLVHREHAHAVHDLKFREIVALVPLCVFIVWIGLQPGFFLERMAPALDKLSLNAAQKLQAEDDRQTSVASLTKKVGTAGTDISQKNQALKNPMELARVH
jgi:NADH-quinone oxidoreductase subunit M